MAEILEVQAGLIMRALPEEIEVFIASRTEGNPYIPHERYNMGMGLYCETVLSEGTQLYVPNALDDDKWHGKPGVKAEMVSYLGVPLVWPDGSIWGTICVLDAKTRHYSDKYQKMLWQFKETIETDFQLITKKEELREKQRLFDTIINTIPDIICLKDGQGRWLLANNYDLDLFELSGVAYKGKTDAELAPYSDFYRDALLTCIETDNDTWEKKQTCRGEEIIPRPDGSNRIFDIVKIPLFTPEGNRHALVVAGRDITELRKAEKKLLEQKNLLNSIFRSAPIGIGLVADRIFKWTNQKVCEITGYSSDELVGQCSRMLYASDKEYERVGQEKYAQFSGKGTGSVESCWLRKDGTRIDILLSSTPIDPDDLSAGVTFTVLDITESKKAQKLNEENERRFRLLFEKAPMPYQSLNRKAIIIDVNQIWLESTGYSRNEVCGKSFVDFIKPSAKTVFEENFKRLIDQGYTRNVEFEMIKKDHSHFWASFDGQVLHNKKGELIQIYCVFRDITRERKINEMLTDSKFLLEQEVKDRTRELRRQGKEQQKTLLTLQQKSQELHEANIALKVLLEQSSKAQRGLEKRIESNIKELIFPYLDELDMELADQKGQVYVDIIRKNIEKITSPFSNKLTSKLVGLTPRELQVAEFVKQGRANKDIADLLHLSPGTVDVYRNNIRKKLGLKNKKINLRVYLLTHF